MPIWKPLVARICPGTLLLLFACAVSLPAQVVSGRLVRLGGSVPISGALVVLLTAEGAQASGSLTDADGGFTIRAPAAGQYTLRAEQIGYATVTSPPLTLHAPDTLEYVMEARVEAVRMEGLTVTGRRRRCEVRPREGEQLHTLWEEARKALNAAAWTQDQALFRFRYVRYERELDPALLRVRTHRELATAGLSANPFVSAPAEQLEEDGYVQADGTEFIYFAPDADVLLSDSFLDGHCFRVAAADPEQEGLIGLAFEPVSRRGPPNVEGVLWLDRTTAELHHLEYRYTRLDTSAPTNAVGGYIEFERLPTGAWITRRWYIRMPIIATRSFQWQGSTSQTSYTLMALREEGGEVVAILTPAGEVIRAGALTNISGSVFDSIAGAPLAGAEVFIVGADGRSVTDETGRFLIGGVLGGKEYVLSFSHPRLDSLDYSPPGRVVEVEVDEARGIELAIPSVGGLRSAACAGSGGGVVFGSVVNSVNALPLAGARVALATEADAAIQEQATDGEGRYLFCAVPTEVALSVRADVPGSATRERFRVADGGAPVQQDLALSIYGAVARTDGGSVYRATHQPVRVEGIARDAETMRPIPGASVRIRPVAAGAGRPITLPEQSTDGRGRFVVADMPPGSYVVEVRHPGHEDHDSPLAVGGGTEMEVEFLIPPRSSSGAFPGGAARGGSNVITREELRRSRSANVYELVEELHPQWLRKRGLQSFYQERQIAVYLDTGRIGGPEALREILTASVVSIRYYDIAAANYRFGPGHTHGVIQVLTGS